MTKILIIDDERPIRNTLREILEYEKYKVDDAGRICEQIILESRLNGVLTPGDALTKWIKGLSRVDDDDNNSMPTAVDSIMDAMKWVRSIQKGNK